MRHFDYGQRHRAEIDVARELFSNWAPALAVLGVVSMNYVSSLTRDSIPVPGLRTGCQRHSEHLRTGPQHSLPDPGRQYTLIWVKASG